MSHRVHGLAGDDIRPDWPPLTHAEIDRVLDAYALGTRRGTPWLSPRPLSAAALVETDDMCVFIKRHHHRVRDVDSLTEEHRFMAHLRRHGLPVPPVHADRRGATAHEHGDWTYEVHACARGRDLYRDTASWTPLLDLDHARAAGAMLARLHRAAASHDAPQRSTHILVARDDLLRAADPVAALESQLPERPGLAGYLAGRSWREDFARWIAPRHARLQPRLARQPRTWSHNDWHVSNLCWHDDGRVSDVLDFGLASPTGTLFDLATAIERNAIAWLELERGTAAVHVDTALALLEGYQETTQLSADERDILAALLPLVHLEFALSEIEYFHAVTGAEADADVAYDTFLLGHATWFDEAPARDLLQAVTSGA